LAILTYLEVSQLVIESKHLAENITFRSMKNTTEAELQWLLQKTYIDSLDCPQIHGMRRIQDIIAGHREQGTYDEELWTIAEFDGKLAGVLLLNRVPEMGCMELAYVGCVPEARGCGLGDALIELAMQQAADCGLPRITLAVDSENLPAFELYRRWGFRETRKRYTMIKKFY
jgi:ribosomal protein S18 acetylase RimI-like enzyme